MLQILGFPCKGVYREPSFLIGSYRCYEIENLVCTGLTVAAWFFTPHLSKSKCLLFSHLCLPACFVIPLLACYQTYDYPGDLKLQRGEKAKKDRKEKRREKNQQNGEIDNKKHGHKKRHRDERSHNDQKGKEHRKRRKKETEEFEKSSLTEEHGHSVSSQNLCDSSDSTLNSSKRQKQRSPPDGGHNPGGTIRIHLPLQRQKDPQVLSSIEHPCSAFTSQDLTFTSSEVKRWPSSAASEVFSPTTAISCLYGSDSPLDLRFRDLIEKWVPPLTQSECTDLEDQEWLFSTKQNHNFETKRFKAASGSLGCESSTPWSHVCYLSEADIYALPFTLPF